MPNLFSDIPESEFQSKKVYLFSDGGSRGNPGISGCGGVLFNEEKEEIKTYYKSLGHQTNNFAEYMGLILGMKEAQALNVTELEVRMDSKLAVEQMKGAWKVKHPQIKLLWNEAKALEANFKNVNYKYIPREQNVRADEMANKAMDEGR